MVEPVVFPVTVIVSVLVLEKSTSILIVPPPVRLPDSVKASFPALSLRDKEPANASSPVVKVCVPLKETTAPVCTETFSQLVMFVAVRACVPETNCKSSTD